MGGTGTIARVDVSADDGGTWAAAEVEPATSRHTWQCWSVAWRAIPGSYERVVRATDDTGETELPAPTASNADEANWVHRAHVRVDRA